MIYSASEIGYWHSAVAAATLLLSKKLAKLLVILPRFILKIEWYDYGRSYYGVQNVSA